MGGQITDSYLFGPFRLDPAECLLLRDGLPVPLAPKEFDTLRVLVENAGHLMSKEELIAEVWPDSFVGDGSLTRNISVLRKTLGEGFIETIPTKGYRFAAPVQSMLKGSPEGLAESELISPPEIAPRVTASEQVRAKAKPVEAMRGARRWIWPTALTALVLAVVLSYFGVRRFLRQVPVKPEHVVLAVVPFVNLTGDEKQDYFSDGMTEELITNLARLDPERLGVIARTTSMTYKNANKSVEQIGRELKADYVLECSVRRSSDRVHINAQLIRVRDQLHVWADKYESALRDIVYVQGDLTQAITKQVQLQLGAPLVARFRHPQPVKPKAYEAYLMGRLHWNSRNGPDVLKAISYFEQAIQEQPDYARAYAGLAEAHITLNNQNAQKEVEDYYKDAEQYALKALELDDSLSEAHTALAYIKFRYHKDWQSAEPEFRRAIELDPVSAHARHWYAVALKVVGRQQEAIREFDRALELDPLAYAIICNAAMAYYVAKQPAKAKELLARAIQLDPRSVFAHGNLALVCELLGEYDKAAAEFRRAMELDAAALPYLAGVGHALAFGGRKEEARKVLAQLLELSRQQPVPRYDLALIYEGLGERDTAFQWLARAFKETELKRKFVEFDPRLAALRSDRRYANFMRQFQAQN